MLSPETNICCKLCNYIFAIKESLYWIKTIILCLNVVQQNMRVTRRIVLTLLTKELYKFGCFKERVWSFLKFWIFATLLFYWVALRQFCMIKTSFAKLCWHKKIRCCFFRILTIVGKACKKNEVNLSRLWKTREFFQTMMATQIGPIHNT